MIKSAKIGENIRVYNEDCLIQLKKFPDKTFNLIFADPPYALSNGGMTCKSGKMVNVNKGRWDQYEDYNALHSFNLEWLAECRRILHDDGTIFVSGTVHNIYSVGHIIVSLGFKILNDITWFKINPPPNLGCRQFTHSTEQIIWAKKSAKSKHFFNYELMKKIGDPNPGKQMLSLWRILPPRMSEKVLGKHPTQKPIELLNRIVLATTRPGDKVLDPFCGSGTTGVACVDLDRDFTGIESDPGYAKLSIKRLQASLSANPKTSGGTTLK